MFKFIKKLFLKLFKKQKCFYINGPETLPPPLSKEKEAEIMEEIQNGIEDNRELLIIHNLRLVVYIAKKFESKTTSTEDLVSIGTIGLMKAVKTFNPEKNIKLATYASRCIENEILMHLRKINNMKSEMSFDEPLSVDWDGNELTLRDVLGTDPDDVYEEIEYDDEKRLLRKTVDSLDEKERNLMVLRFGLDGNEALTQKQLADKMGISQSYISRLEKKILECAGANSAEIHQQRGNEQRRRYDGIVEQEGNHREDQHQQQLHPAVAQMKKGGSGVVKRYTLHGTAPFIAATSPAAWEQV